LSARRSDEPRKREQRAARRRAQLAQRLAAARTPARRIGAASDHLRGAVASVPVQIGDRIAAEAVAHLTRLADQLLDQEGRLHDDD
jgi:hypothetical protein